MTDKTERLTLLKLELTGPVSHQLDVVEHGVYSFGVQNHTSGEKEPVKDNTVWQTTDEKLYKDAKQSYDKIISIFQSKPKVYKLAAVKEKIWNSNSEQLEANKLNDNIASTVNRVESSAQAQKSPSRKKKKNKNGKDTSNIISDAESIHEASIVEKDILETYLNPFQIGTSEEVWKEKLDILEKLTPREDLDGFEYREDYNEQQMRFALQNDYAERLKAELRRRQHHPTEIEQIEDVLFDLIEKVVVKEEQETGDIIAYRVESTLETRHPATRACKLKRLPAIENEKGDISFILSDLEYVDMSISPSGYAIAPTIPNKTLLLHEQEREYERQMKSREEEDREAMRRMPLTHKLRSAIALAKVDKNEAVREALRGIVDSAVVLPTRPIRNVIVDYLKKGKYLLSKITSDPVDSFQEFLQQISDKVEALRKAQADANYKPDLSNAKSLVDEAKRVIREKGEMNKFPGDTNFEPTTISSIGWTAIEPPDAVMITFKVHFEVPPAYVIRHRRTVQLELEKLSKRAKELAIKYKLIENGGKIERMKAKTKKAIENISQPSTGESPQRHFNEITGNESIVAPNSERGNNLGIEKSDTQTLAAEGTEEIEDEKEDDEVIPLKRIVGSKSYNGYLHLEDMITPKVKTDENHKNVPLVRDSSLREHFEHSFLEQVAFACGIPVENINIEQIRRLEPDNCDLIRKIEEKKQHFQDRQYLKQESDVIESVRRLVRKAFAKGIILDEDLLIVTELQHLRETQVLQQHQFNVDKEDDASTVLAGLHLLDENDSVASENDSENNQIRKEVKLVIEDIVSTLEKENDNVRPVVASVVDDIIDIIEKTAELASILDFSFDVASDMSFDEDTQSRIAKNNINNIANNSNNNEEGTVNFSVSTASYVEDSPTHGKVVSSLSACDHDDINSRMSSGEESMNLNNVSVAAGSVACGTNTGSHVLTSVAATIGNLGSQNFGKSQPIMPKAFEMGIANPSLLLTDEKYWLAKALKARSDDDKRRYRLRKLAKLRDYYYKNRRGKLYACIQDIKAEALLTKADFIEDLNDFLEPLMIYVDKMLDIIRPEMFKFQHQLSIALKMVVMYAYKALEEAKSRQQGLQRLFPANLPVAKSRLQEIENNEKAAENDNDTIPESKTMDSENDSVIRNQVQAYLSELVSLVEKSAAEVVTTSTDNNRINSTEGDKARPKINLVEGQEVSVSEINGGSDKIIPLAIKETENISLKSQNRVVHDESEGESNVKNGEDEEEEQEEEGEEIEENNEDMEDNENQIEESVHFQLNEKDLENDLNTNKLEKIEEKSHDNRDIKEDVLQKEIHSRDQQINNEDMSNKGENKEDDSENDEEFDEKEEGEGEEGEEEEESNEEEEDSREKSGIENQSLVEEESLQLDANIDSGAAIDNATTIDSPTSKNSSPLSSARHSSSQHKKNRYQVKNILHPSSYHPVQRIALIAQIFEKELANEANEANEGAPSNTDTINIAEYVTIPTPHERAMDRVRQTKIYDDEIVNVMESLIQDVEEYVLLSEQQAMLKTETQSSEEDNRWKKMTFGSEITVIVRICPEQRQVVEGLLELKSEDIGYFLKQQCNDPFSVLNQGSITQHIVDVSFKPLFQKANAVSSWQSYWIQRIHPSFYNYTAKKRIDLKTGKTIKTKVRFQEDNESNTLKFREGLTIVNPLETLDERTKEAMMALNKKPVLLRPGERLKRYEDQPNMKNHVSSDVIDFDVDEFGKEFESKGVQLYRPNMETLTDKDVRRCYRVYQAFKEAQDKEMARGLVNNGLLPSQYQAMKDMATAFRIYRSARQKMQQNVRRRQKQGLEIDLFAPPPLHVTNINQDLFDTWIEEVKEEDRIRLQAKREQKEKMKEALQLEAELRRETAKRKIWVLENFVKFYQEGKPKQATDGMLSEDASRMTTPAKKERMSELHLLPTEDNASIAENSLAYSISTVDAPISDFRHQLPEKTQAYYKYTHDALELNGAILKQMETLEKEKEILITKAPKVDDGVNKLSEEEKMVLALHEAENEKKKVIISEEKRTRRLFGLLLKWEKFRRFQMDNCVMKSPDGHSQLLSKRIFSNSNFINPPIMEENEQIKAKSAVSLQSPFVKKNDFSAMVDDAASAHSSVTGISQSIDNVSTVLTSSPLTATSHTNTNNINTNTKTNTNNTLKFELEEDENGPSRTISKLDTLSFLLYVIDNMDKGAGDINNDNNTPNHSAHSLRGKSRQTKSRSKQNVRHLSNSKKDEKHNIVNTATEGAPPQFLTSSSMSMLPPVRSAPAISTDNKSPPSLLKQTLSSKSMAATPILHDRNTLGGHNTSDIVAVENQPQMIPVIEDPELGAMIDAAISGNHSLPKDETGLTLLVLEDDAASVLSRENNTNAHTSHNSSPSRKGGHGAFVMSAEDWELIRGIQWISAIRDQLPLLDCLLHFPTSDIHRISRDELAQWATIMVHVYPIFAEAVKKLNEAKLQAELALGVKTNKLSRNRHRGVKETQDQTVEEIAKEKLLQAEREAGKRLAEVERLEEIRRTAEREKAWFMAHPHKYMHPKGQKDAPTFCLICHAKAHEYWMKCHTEGEKDRQENLEKIFSDIIEEKEEYLIDAIEKEQKSTLENKAKALVEQALVREGVVNLEDTDFSVSEDTNSTHNTNNEVALWQEKMQKIRAYLRRHNVPFADAKGKALLPKKAPKKLRNINVRPKSPSALSGKTNVTMDTTTSFAQLEDVDPQDIATVRARTSLKFRVFHRDHESLEKAIFLGMCEFTTADLMDPPKGYRTFKLKAESHFPDTENITNMIGGTIAVMVRLTTQQKKDGSERYNWRVTIKKLSKLPHVDKHKLTNPYVEIFWQGEAEKYQRPAFIASYAIVGQSKTKFETVNAEFNDREYHDLSQFELPPMWTDLPIPHRGLKENDVSQDGGYIAKNWQALVEAHHMKHLEELSANTPGSTLSLGTSGVPLNEIRRFRRQRQYKELLAQELKIAVEGERYILLLQEKERLFMAKEEMEQRCREDTAEQALYADELAVQERFALNFQRLLEFIVAPSPLLSRLRFLMGEQGNAQNDDDNNNEDAHNNKHQKEDTAEQKTISANKHKHSSDNHPHITDALLVSLTATSKPFPKATRATEEEKETTTNLNSSSSPTKLPQLSVMSSTNNNNNNNNNIVLSPEKIKGRKIEGSGSMRVLCEDPSTGDLLRVIVLPILNEADEASIRTQAMTLAGMRPCALTRILDVTVHDIRSYNAQGFTAIQERHAVVIMEYVNGATLGRHLFDHWDKISNSMLRGWLTQITEALASFHEQGLIHRNLSPKAFVVHIGQTEDRRLSSLQARQQLHNNKSKNNTNKRGGLNASLEAKVTVKIQEYWFLENPRAANATLHAQTMAMPQALGRGAWGCRLTAPPEVRNPAFYQQQAFQQYKQTNSNANNITNNNSYYSHNNNHVVKSVSEMAYITDKADIFAFGACVYFWATKGLLLPMDFFQHGNIDALSKFVPMKWRPWVMILLRMTLSLNPMRRASAQELTAFLSGDTGN